MTAATARVDPRMRARRVAVTREQGRRRLRVLLVVVIAAAIGGGAWLAVTSPLLDVDRIVVRGTSQASSREAIRAAAGVRTGDALLLLDVGELERRIEAVPSVGEAHVRRHLPDELDITVVERVAAGWARRDREQVALVDGTGRVIADTSTPPPDLPEVLGLTRLPAPGGQVAPKPATGVLEELPTALRNRVESVAVMGGVAVLTLVDGVEVRLGPAIDVVTKGRTAQAVLAALGDARIAYVDVRVPGAPVTG